VYVLNQVQCLTMSFGRCGWWCACVGCCVYALLDSFADSISRMCLSADGRGRGLPPSSFRVGPLETPRIANNCLVLVGSQVLAASPGQRGLCLASLHQIPLFFFFFFFFLGLFWLYSTYSLYAHATMLGLVDPWSLRLTVR
jgi:hypothetical protein